MNDREARYTEAIHGQPAARILTADGVVTDEVRAVMAVADEELAELRAEVERLRGKVRFAEGAHWAAEERHDALVADLRGLADSWDPPVTTQLLQEGFGWDEDMSALANDIRAVLDKHAGEQAQGGEGRG